jgi:hypothetical protein
MTSNLLVLAIIARNVPRLRASYAIAFARTNQQRYEHVKSAVAPPAVLKLRRKADHLAQRVGSRWR